MPSKRIEALWSDLCDARCKLDVAWERASKAERDLLSGGVPTSDGRLAHKLALREEEAANLRYSKALETFKTAVLFSGDVDEEFPTA